MKNIALAGSLLLGMIQVSGIAARGADSTAPATGPSTQPSGASASAPSTQPANEAAAWIGKLGNEDFHVRREAARKLKAMGKAAIPALQEARKSADPEIHAQAEEILQQIDQPAVATGPVPRPTGFGNQSVSVSVINGAKTIDAQEPGRVTHIEENGSGIRMTVTGQLEGQQVTREYKASNPEQLKKENPEAFALYQQWNGGAVGGQFNLGGHAIIHQHLQININGNNMQIAPGVVAVPARPIPVPNADNLQDLQEKVQRQMQEKNLPQPRQEEINALFKQLSEARVPLNPADKDIDAHMREYNERADALRKRLAELQLPDPGDALPPPLAGRLGISAAEEIVSGQGLTITHVLPDSRAQKIGLREGDMLQKVNGQEIHSTRELRKAVMEHTKGLSLEITRDGKSMKLNEI